MRINTRQSAIVKGTFSVEAPLLFELPEIPSPKLAWYRSHRIRVAEGKDGRIEAIGVFRVRDDLSRAVVCVSPGWGEFRAEGRDEEDAVANLAVMAGVSLWFEEGFCSKGQP